LRRDFFRDKKADPCKIRPRRQTACVSVLVLRLPLFGEVTLRHFGRCRYLSSQVFLLSVWTLLRSKIFLKLPSAKVHRRGSDLHLLHHDLEREMRRVGGRPIMKLGLARIYTARGARREVIEVGSFQWRSDSIDERRFQADQEGNVSLDVRRGLALGACGVAKSPQIEEVRRRQSYFRHHLAQGWVWALFSAPRFFLELNHVF